MSKLIKGIRLDADQIAEGLYGIIQDRGEESIVAFGMLPKWLMDIVEKQMRQKLIDIALAQKQVTEQEFSDFGLLAFDEAKISAIVQELIHEVTVSIFAVAQRKGLMIV